MSFISNIFKKTKPQQQQQPQPQAAPAKATEPEGDTAAQKRNKRRRGTRTILTEGGQTNLGATGGKSLLGA